MELGGAGIVDILRTLDGCVGTSDGPDDDCADMLTLSNQRRTLADQIHARIGGETVEGWTAPASHASLFLYGKTDRGPETSY